ncbi:MAG TPA: flagellar basal body-associated FliL family protein [Deltaproteobacteria bacterium]|nr:flagellar basal body-associated FliL family protein [Deltaproteobacteria bacterium]
MAREREEEKEKEEGQEEPKKKKRSAKLFIIIGVAVVLLVGGAGGAYYFLFMGKPGHGDGKKVAAEKSHGEKGEAAEGANKNLDPFIVNLTDAQGTRYLKAVMQLELGSPEISAELDEKMPMIRDDIISLLSSKSFEDISTEPGKRELKKAIIERINRNLERGQVTRVFFTEFVVQ